MALVRRWLAGVPNDHRQAVDPVSLDGIDRQTRCRDVLRRLPVRVTACPNPAPQGGHPVGQPTRQPTLGPDVLAKDELPTWLQDTPHFGQSAPRILNGAERQRHRHRVEALVAKRQVLSTGLLEPNRPSKCGCSLLRSPEHVGIGLDAEVVHARRKVAPVAAHAHPSSSTRPDTCAEAARRNWRSTLLSCLVAQSQHAAKARWETKRQLPLASDELSQALALDIELLLFGGRPHPPGFTHVSLLRVQGSGGSSTGILSGQRSEGIHASFPTRLTCS